MLETPERTYVPEQSVPRRTSATPRRRLRRDFDDDFSEDFGDLDQEDGAGVRRKAKSVQLKWRGLPKSLWGRIAAGTVLAAVLGLGVAAALAVRGMLLRDERFMIPDSSAIQIEGNRHLTRAQLLSIFGEDVDRNIFTVSLVERQAQLERLPWVQHATVMRLLPDHLRVSIVERTPAAFVRQGNRIGMVDGSGVLLDMPSDVRDTTHYSFPVVTGIRADDPQSTRAARMKLYRQFTAELDGDGTKISEQLSEIDLSDPEDVKALIPDKSSDILVHFGDTDFVERYHKYETHLAEWKTQYPKLASVDMRYDQQVVLKMRPENETTAGAAASAAKFEVPAPQAPKSSSSATAPAMKAVSKPSVVHAVATRPAAAASKDAPAKKPPAKPAMAATVPAAPKPAPVGDTPKAAPTAQTGGASNVSHWVAPNKNGSAAKTKAIGPMVAKKKVVKPHAAAASKSKAVKPKPVKTAAQAKPIVKQGAQ